MADTPIPVELARALAQAASGYYQQEPFYFTASYTQQPDSSNPYDIGSPSPTPPTNLQDGYGVFGPFVNHMAGVVPNPGQSTVTSITVSTSAPSEFSITAEDGSPLPIDAMFFSLEAVAKFAVPYYTVVYAAPFAETLLQSFQQSKLGLMVHLPWSESEDLNTHGQPEPFVIIR
jgi:hypothetical protein